MLARILFFVAAALVIITAPVNAFAQTVDASAQVPEGSSLTLFALGFAGLLLGRRFARSKRHDNNTRD